MYYLGSRYYNPEVGRFLNADVPETLTVSPMSITDKNLYAYCDNNPVNRTDSNGKLWAIAGGAIAGGLISFISHLVVNGGIDEETILQDLVLGAVGGAIGACAGLFGTVKQSIKLAYSVGTGFYTGLTSGGNCGEIMLIAVTTTVATYAGASLDTNSATGVSKLIGNGFATIATGVPAEIINTPIRINIEKRNNNEIKIRPRGYVSVMDAVLGM